MSFVLLIVLSIMFSKTANLIDWAIAWERENFSLNSLGVWTNLRKMISSIIRELSSEAAEEKGKKFKSISVIGREDKTNQSIKLPNTHHTRNIDNRR